MNSTAREKLFTAIGCCVLIALVCGGMSANQHFRQRAIDEKRELFEREGQTSTCEVVDASKNLSRQVLRTRGGTEIRTGREHVTSTSVTCRFLANGAERTDTFTVPIDLEKSLEMNERQAELASMFGDRGGIGDRVLAATERRREAWFTITYLASDPRRAVLGPLSTHFPKGRDGVDGILGLAFTFGLLALVLGAVAFMLRAPRAVEDEEPD